MVTDKNEIVSLSKVKDKVSKLIVYHQTGSVRVPVQLDDFIYTAGGSDRKIKEIPLNIRKKYFGIVIPKLDKTKIKQILKNIKQNNLSPVEIQKGNHILNKLEPRETDDYYKEYYKMCPYYVIIVKK